jgi:hypothetical protein
LNQTANDTTTNIDIPSATTPPSVRLIPWLDDETTAALVDITRSVAEHHPEVQAVILFGSVARQEERSLDGGLRYSSAFVRARRRLATVFAAAYGCDFWSPISSLLHRRAAVTRRACS